MRKSKYSNILTIILSVVLIAILGIIIYLGMRWYNESKTTKTSKELINFIDGDENVVDTNTDVDSEKPEISNITNITDITPIDVPTVKPYRPKKKKNISKDGFVVVGKINIPKTNIEYPILESISTKALEVGVVVAYPSNPQLNTKGNVVIQGHNYRNGKFFSNNKKLAIGDKIKITDVNKRTLTYTIYDIYETTDKDSSYFTRNTGDNIEISLSTCTDNGKRRLIILAKV